jgi:hypothetical protein
MSARQARVASGSRSREDSGDTFEVSDEVKSSGGREGGREGGNSTLIVTFGKHGLLEIESLIVRGEHLSVGEVDSTGKSALRA